MATARVHLTPEERLVIDKVLRSGLDNPKGEQWLVARLALARSLQIPSVPGNEFDRPSAEKGGSQLQDEQVTGDFRDAFAALISIHANRDLFTDQAGLDDLINRHIRRGLKEIRDSWREGNDFYDYLLQDVYFDRDTDIDGGAAANSASLGDNLMRLLGQLGIAADLIASTDGPRLTRFSLELGALDDLDRLKRSIEKIAFGLGLGEDKLALELAGGERRVTLDVPRPIATWRTVGWTDLSPALGTSQTQRMVLPVLVGTDVLGEPLIFDLADTPHLFVGGTTGSGKSMCVHALLLSLLRMEVQAIELVLIDPKGVEFQGYAGAKHVRGGRAVTDMDVVPQLLAELIETMQERQAKLQALDARNIAEAIERGAKMPRIVVVIDELGDLFNTHRSVEAPLIRLAQKARAVGIHLVLATQRPEAATFPGLLRSNVPSRIALTVQKSSESRIILDETGAENLLMRGDMLVRLAGRPTRRAHGCLVEPGDIVAAARGRG